MFVYYGMIENVFDTNSGEVASYFSTYFVILTLLLLLLTRQLEPMRSRQTINSIGNLRFLIVVTPVS
ncbi:phosphoethanolamine transferase domain-containing protein [Photobacterium damselae]|uniref:phosphoethanolamine transferase domain-containing protein n=1 Tax=Photobacterium damselae TaxID=38293 RepID=UPI00387EB772